MSRPGLAQPSVSSALSSFDDLYPEYSSQSLRDTSPLAGELMSPGFSKQQRTHGSPSMFSSLDDTESDGRVKLPAIAKSAWTPSSTKRVGFERSVGDADQRMNATAPPVMTAQSPSRPAVSMNASTASISSTKSRNNQFSSDNDAEDPDLEGATGWFR